MLAFLERAAPWVVVGLVTVLVVLAIAMRVAGVE
jgi:hypothetical protein